MTTQLQPTAYMKYLLRWGSNREAIALKLFEDCKEQNPQAFEIVTATGDKTFNADTFLEAADIVLNSN